MMVVEPGRYKAILPADPDRMTDAQRWLDSANGKLIDWGFREDSGIDVEFTTTKAAEWPAELPAPKLVGVNTAPALVHVPAPKKKKNRKKKDNVSTLFFLWLLTKGM